MTPLSRPTGPNWLSQVFSAKAVANGGVVRRKINNIGREVGRDLFEREVRRRGFHLIANGRDYIVICNNAPIHVIS